MKKFIKISAMVIVGLAVFATIAFRSGMFNHLFMHTHTSGDYAVYRSIDSLATRATDIVRGEILDERVERVNSLLPPLSGCSEWYLTYRHDFYEISTINRIRVIEVFKGDAQVGDIMDVAQLGGRIGLSSLINESRLQFEIGDDLVFFMRTFYASHGVHRPATLLTPAQTAYYTIPPNARGTSELSESIIAAYLANPLLADKVLESFSPNNNLTLTVGDLMWIRYESGLGERPGHGQKVDRDNLYAAIAEAESLLKHYYNFTLQSLVPLNRALEAAQTTRDNPSATQHEVDTAAENLWAAIQALAPSTSLCNDMLLSLLAGALAAGGMRENNSNQLSFLMDFLGVRELLEHAAQQEDNWHYSVYGTVYRWDLDYLIQELWDVFRYALHQLNSDPNVLKFYIIDTGNFDMVVLVMHVDDTVHGFYLSSINMINRPHEARERAIQRSGSNTEIYIRWMAHPEDLPTYLGHNLIVPREFVGVLPRPTPTPTQPPSPINDSLLYSMLAGAMAVGGLSTNCQEHLSFLMRITNTQWLLHFLAAQDENWYDSIYGTVYRWNFNTLANVLWHGLLTYMEQPVCCCSRHFTRVDGMTLPCEQRFDGYKLLVVEYPTVLYEFLLDRVNFVNNWNGAVERVIRYAGSNIGGIYIRWTEHPEDLPTYLFYNLIVSVYH